MTDSCPARFTKCQKVALMIGTAKGERRYRYYVSRRLVTGSADKVRKGWRLSGPEIERIVAVAARQLLNDHAGNLGRMALPFIVCNSKGAGESQPVRPPHHTVESVKFSLLLM